VCSSVVRSVVYCFVGMFAGLALVGCGGPKLKAGEREQLPIPMEITVGAQADVNPAADGRPSPVFVRVFELANDSRFQSADYSELIRQDSVTLEGDVLSSEERSLIPGEGWVVRKRASLQTKFLGVAAGYRDTNSIWRAVTPMPEPYLAGRLWTKSVSPTMRLYVRLDGSGVTLFREEELPKK